MTHIDTDPRRGHCYVRTDERKVATLLDLGGICAIETEGPLTPTEARMLGRALFGWAAFRQGIAPAPDHYETTTPSPAVPATRED